MKARTLLDRLIENLPPKWNRLSGSSASWSGSQPPADVGGVEGFVAKLKRFGYTDIEVDEEYGLTNPGEFAVDFDNPQGSHFSLMLNDDWTVFAGDCISIGSRSGGQEDFVEVHGNRFDFRLLHDW
jgi:hypothetical protein